MMNFHILRHYQAHWFSGDLRAALFSTLLLIPQSLAYASVAGLPPHIGLYAGLLPLMIYAFLGSSPTLSIGPVAILSLMTASALAPLTLTADQYIAAAALLALMSGLLLVLFGVLRLGALAYFLSHPVIRGFISGSAVVIMIGQLRPLLGASTSAHSTPMIIWQLLQQWQHISVPSLITGLISLLLLLLAKYAAPNLFKRLGFRDNTVLLFSRSLPMLLVLASIAVVIIFKLDNVLALVGNIPEGLPTITLPFAALPFISALFLPALFIALVGYVESIAIARSLALRSRKNVQPDKELLSLGAANIGAALSGSMPVTGSFVRSAITVEAGAHSPLAGLLSALFVAFVLLWGSQLFTHLPLPVLAATIIMAVSSLIDTAALKKIWHNDRSDAYSMIGTFIAVVFAGVETGIAIGIGLSLFSVIWRASHPYIAIIGRIPGTNHFRNIRHYQVETVKSCLMIRIDENLFFGNAHVIEQRLRQEWAKHPEARHLVLVMSSVSHIDSTALSMLETLNEDLRKEGKLLHLAELKAFVLKPIQHSDFIQQLSGQIFLTAADAQDSLSSTMTQQELSV